MRVLITGVTGFVGSHLADYLVARGDVEVFGTLRWRSRMENVDHLRTRVHFVECDLRDAGAVRRMLQAVAPDRVFHLAAQSYVPTSWIAPVETLTGNVTCEVNPVAVCVGSFLPFSITYWLNGHSFIERELRRAGVAFRKDDNAFLWVADRDALQAAADRLSPQLIRKRLDYWTWVVGPKFSAQDRQAINLHRQYSIQQVEYCRNVIFRRHSPIHQLFERSCDLGLFRLTADTIAQVFGFRLHKRLPGKLSTVLDQIEHGHHVLRCYARRQPLRAPAHRPGPPDRHRALGGSRRGAPLVGRLEHHGGGIELVPAP